MALAKEAIAPAFIALGCLYFLTYSIQAEISDEYYFNDPPDDQWSFVRAKQIEKARSRRSVLSSNVTGTGWWSTSGNQIIDEFGNEVHFSGVNWDGFEYPGCVIDGVQTGVNRSFLGHLDQMKFLGINLIRLPFAGTCIQPGMYPVKGYVDFSFNLQLVNLTSFEILKLVVKEAGIRGMRVILDFHRIGPPFYPTYGPELGLWYNATYPVSFWLDTWKMVVTEFVNDSTVVGVDLFNEPHHSSSHDGPFWLPYDKSPKVNWRLAAKQAGDMILGINPNLLICVQGLWNNTWFGENLQAVKALPLVLSVANKLVYEVHDYGPLLEEQPWDHVPDFPANLVPFWDTYWGYVHQEGIAPVWLGEFGSRLNESANIYGITAAIAANQTLQEWEWLSTLVEYIYEHHLSWTWFAWTPDGVDIGGFLADDWKSVRYDKVAIIEKLFYPQFKVANYPPPPSHPPPSPPVLEGVPVVYVAPASVPGTYLAPVSLGTYPPPPPVGTKSSGSRLFDCQVLAIALFCGLASIQFGLWG